MSMTVRHLPDPASFSRLNSAELRNAFLLDNLFVPGGLSMVYCDADRAIVGGAMPANEPLTLPATRKEMAAKVFTERREIGIVNLGQSGGVSVGNTEYHLDFGEMLFVGKGNDIIRFHSSAGTETPLFYFVSFPAHSSFPAVHVHAAEAQSAQLGTAERANRRTINRYIHPEGAKSCQLVMGLTRLDQGSVWNTMPPHTHQRRMEVYLYFGLQPDECVFHLMGTPSETRHLTVRNLQAVISPSWSLHAGVGTASYSFIWAMGGENQEFADMDQVAIGDLY
jgi:4-deoxy-L-threo-5-hexosulose-uronate ketol-isomerase